MAFLGNATAKGSVTLPGSIILAIVTATLIAVVIIALVLY